MNQIQNDDLWIAAITCIIFKIQLINIIIYWHNIKLQKSI